MFVNVEKDPKPMKMSRPWIVKMDGRVIAWGFKTKKDAVLMVESTGNKVLKI